MNTPDEVRGEKEKIVLEEKLDRSVILVQNKMSNHKEFQPVLDQLSPVKILINQIRQRVEGGTDEEN